MLQPASLNSSCLQDLLSIFKTSQDPVINLSITLGPAACEPTLRGDTLVPVLPHSQAAALPKPSTGYGDLQDNQERALITCLKHPVTTTTPMPLLP